MVKELIKKTKGQLLKEAEESGYVENEIKISEESLRNWAKHNPRDSKRRDCKRDSYRKTKEELKDQLLKEEAEIVEAERV